MMETFHVSFNDLAGARQAQRTIISQMQQRGYDDPGVMFGAKLMLEETMLHAIKRCNKCDSNTSMMLVATFSDHQAEFTVADDQGMIISRFTAQKPANT